MFRYIYEQQNKNKQMSVNEHYGQINPKIKEKKKIYIKDYSPYFNNLI